MQKKHHSASGKDEEYLDLVDRNDRVVGKMLRSHIYAKGLKNYRVVNVFVKNSGGQLWIPKRTAQKKIFPLCLDVGVGGHVTSGQTYEEAFKTEAFEELNLDISQVFYRPLGHLTPKDEVSSFMKVYEIEMNKLPNYNPKDFCGYFWLTPTQVLEKITAGAAAKPDLSKLLKIFYH
ncbi:NUDIX hydrolase [candidate division WWE3 bacterium CG06_land_8_20_14_3_00_42_16]|uniref:NUDIX hydrolase n=4 Tax=Katanobacteria TaxID=422282 RepID=A0A2M7ANQ4_UNCKA|nr:MAG: NUDIX hydrolase [bacterium CG1_02_42_9]PIU69005.1 MAG: NUDIX hydrolase [candidate division WWE3 bacterium CG06_land_8_20_14_3_00_42_16]PIZ42156.1 MAG: NUDIX hydrolase [candidate division WWE3 bacterium CG_4_10_14_0_2_um_filter_42_8]PJA37681.1 MAG: NUDIX hydrolase [candidate division WWE3 bacterium CG_4_9_14_3_um_filter_43_9]PJC68567.1 MAG: NUDIX hydrolase [candidate division WWE3 bacterium CG_4_8_14_3_um_filter_42_11]